MKNLFLIATTIAAIGSTMPNHADACDLRLPTFELTGFPISRHQVAVLGAAQVEERTAAPTLMLAGMPASPHQIAVLTPHVKTLKTARASVDPSLITVGLTSPGLQRSTGQALCTVD
jgi:hypothetical protein